MGSRRTGNGEERVYQAAERWVDCALRSDDSLFTPGKAIWSSRWLGELHERFLNHPDESSAKFTEKLRQQLSDSPPEVYQLMGEVLYVHLLIVHTKSSTDESKLINEVLEWSSSPAEIPNEYISSLTPGIATPGQYFHSGRPFQVGYIIEFVEQWKQGTGNRELLDDPWKFKDYLYHVQCNSSLFRTDKPDGPILLRAHNLENGAKIAHYSKDGWYVKPRDYPVVLFDLNGYIIFDSESALANFTKAQTHLQPSTLPGYVKCSHSHLESSDTEKARLQREAILHLVFPDIFEPILSIPHKEKIAEAFVGFVVEQTDDLNCRLYQIRQSLQPIYGDDFSFYQPPVKAIWQNGHGPVPPPPPKDLQTLAGELCLPTDFITGIAILLEQKKQVIFQGPPGTGKTYVARELARYLAENEEDVTLVQFHPSYAYEDFVQGIRPRIGDGQVGFDLKDGPLVRAADQARKKPEAKHFLVIDEINRGNLAKVFGELYFLLEYRNKAIRLQYLDKSFSLPSNLYIIGTMNTADRTIALVDLALRRRFSFVEFHPDRCPVQGLLRRWLDSNAPDMAWVADFVDRANEKLNDRHAAIGPSYFMKDGLNEDMARRIWKHNVLPYIEEHLFGEHDRLSEFDLDAFLKAGTPDGEPDEVIQSDAQEVDADSDA